MHKYLSKIINLFKTHKVLIVILAIIVVFIFSKSRIIEGLTNSIGEYTYLAPPTTIYTFDNDTAKKYYTALNSALTSLQSSNTNSNVTYTLTDLSTWDTIMPSLTITYGDNYTKLLNSNYTSSVTNQSTITKEEVDYFIANKKWPWCTYVLNGVTEVVKNDPKADQSLLNTYLNFYQVNLTTRVAYAWFIMQTDSKQDPPPLAYQIYMGTAKPPEDVVPSLSEITTSTVVPSDSDSLYSQCTTFCEKLK